MKNLIKDATGNEVDSDEELEEEVNKISEEATKSKQPST